MEAENQKNSQQMQRQQVQSRTLTAEQCQINLSVMSDPSLLLYNSLLEGKNEMSYKVKLFYSIGVPKTTVPKK